MDDWNVRYAEDAIEDIANIADYIANVLDDPYGALKVASAIESAAQQLVTMPFRFPQCPLEAPDVSECRYAVTGSYVLIFDIEADTQTVIVTNVFHQRQLSWFSSK